MNRLQKSALAAGFLLAAPLIPLRAEDQVSQPEWLKLPHVAEDVTFVPEFDPRLAEGPEVEAMRGKLRGVQGLWLVDSGEKFETFVDSVDNSFIPTVAKEKLLLEAVTYWHENSDKESLSTLRKLATRTPLAYYLAPGCRTDHKHLMFDFQSAALWAIEVNEYSDAAYEYASREPELSKSKNPIAAILRAEQSPARIRGALLAMSGWIISGDDIGHVDHAASNPQRMWHDLSFEADLIEGQLPLVRRYVLEALVDQRGEEGDVRPIVELASRSSERLAEEALAQLLAEEEIEFNTSTTDALMIMATGHTSSIVRGRSAAVLAKFAGEDEKVRAVLLQTLNDPSSGQDAALGLSASTSASDVSELLKTSGDIVAARNAALTLMQRSDSDSRAALTAFASASSEIDTPEFQRLRRKVSQWLAQAK